MRVIPDLVTTHRVIAPDLPGHGASGVDGGPLDADRVLAWLDELIERTCPSPPALVGHVLGGAIAARFAADQGDRLSGLVLVDTLGLGRFRPGAEFGSPCTAFWRDRPTRTHDRFCASARSISTACASRWASAGSRSRPTTSSSPAAPGAKAVGR